MEKIKNVDCRENEQFNKLETITNRLLGNYVDSTYTIDKIISAELATMPKVITSDFNGKIFAESDTNSGKFTFEISFDIENRFANLYILERIVKANGYIVNTLRTLVSSVRCVSADMTEKAKKAFIITDNDKIYESIVNALPIIDFTGTTAFLLPHKFFIDKKYKSQCSNLIQNKIITMEYYFPNPKMSITLIGDFIL